ncbi:MAG TPA: fatty acid desaturase CarF family protein [Myxococcales bacterium]|jgi:ubiquitin-conjugating enzyme E2 variant|nr:fatty acid desaturase CarF family protein [Myxococcales bacterium]
MTPSSADAVAAVPAEEVAAPKGRNPGWTEYVGVAGFFILCLLLGARVYDAIRLGGGGLVLVTAVAGFVAADFLSGLVHWTFDTWFSLGTPVVGKTFVYHFRLHHSDPDDICRQGFICTNGHNCLASIPALLGCLFLPVGTAWGTGLLTFLVATALGTFGTNQFHKWAHEKRVGPVVGFLQRYHLVLNPRHHDIHHTRPYDQHYCITTGWLNPFLRAIHFFRVTEWAITRVTGVEARKDDLKAA